MPIYEYACETCKHQFELIQKFSDTPVTECPLCKGPVRKLISSPGIMFKGSGWYVTDYSDKFKNKSATPSPAPPPPSSKPESKPEPKPKPESKPEPKPESK
ncbi:MAG: zinc ribbon domain-containing protein [Nitrospirae bacterium]|nr:zinc ribbon domain-containing protein [Nitrospirota bacterium]MBI3604447.1 zinc ribbon domain-containing protein [Nitrospirota bacterium]